MNCSFCDSAIATHGKQGNQQFPTRYDCPICGEIFLTEEAAEDFHGERFSDDERRIISCVLRNEYDSRGSKPPVLPLQIEDLHRAVDTYRKLGPLEKLNNALLRLGKMSTRLGSEISLSITKDYPLFHCFDDDEFHKVLRFLLLQDLIEWTPVMGGTQAVSLHHKGYERLQELQKAGIDSTTCFVAMWFNPDMQNVFDQAVKPAIEFTEEGQTEPRFKAIKIDNVEHINDINDEIIANIRRSRFMVCDLTGYRGGVYFEAGFAHGLGLQVIYTCRKDWSSEDKLRDIAGNVVETLKDSSDRDIRVRKEGVHFDLAHRNRIEWEEDKLGEFREKLENRIKAVIV
jgi:nucleoside 2-deoxyribosyltransferase